MVGDSEFMTSEKFSERGEGKFKGQSLLVKETFPFMDRISHNNILKKYFM